MIKVELKLSILLSLFLAINVNVHAQEVQDDFEGNGTISTWFGDDCNLDIGLTNPFQQGINPSATVLEYHDVGGQYANVRFEAPSNFDFSVKNTFSLKVYVPSNGLTGNQTNQISLKLQNGNIDEPWTSQSEFIKPVELDQWQEITVNVEEDNFSSFDISSTHPSLRSDFNRVVIQLNGEDNNDQVLAYLDDLTFYHTASEDPGFDFLVWSDEFEGEGAIDTSKWFHQTQLPNGGSWFNSEIQHYTARVENSFLGGGNLNLTAINETFTDQGVTKEFTSARLNSKFVFTYGRVEVKAKLPTGVGTWPAIWMLGQNISEAGAYWETLGYGTTSWPECGEIDIMEHWGDNQNYVQSAMHTPSSFGATENHGGQYIPNASDDFHVYTMEWTEEMIKFKVDGVTHYTYNPEVKNASTWPFDDPQYILLNIAIQEFIIDSFTQDAMEIDYVRVYQSEPSSIKEEASSIGIDVYPNPISDMLTIKISEGNQLEHAVLINALGQTVKHITSNQFSLANISSGSYVLKIKTALGTFNKKVIKE